MIKRHNPCLVTAKKGNNYHLVVEENILETTVNVGFYSSLRRATKEADFQRRKQAELQANTISITIQSFSKTSKTGEMPKEYALHPHCHRFSDHGAFLGTFRFVGLYKKVLYTAV